ncbi:shikimate kinase [Benzoatithermus flavus]|uniref:Shikimate kinase n=1 Tax=Benzoatithermus flavus TaxID=3108223 RepID=A0ABU8XRU6_9PROT
MPAIATPALAADPPQPGGGPLPRTLVLVGLMGAGKTSIGRRLATAMDATFVDADDEIVAAAGMTIPDIFALYGEPSFRALERKVVARLLEQPPMVLALGGGAFIDPETRARVKEKAISVWLRADLDTLVARTARKKGTRPLLDRGDPRDILARLMDERYPIYAEADYTVDTTDEAHDAVVERVRALLPPATKEA